MEKPSINRPLSQKAREESGLYPPASPFDLLEADHSRIDRGESKASPVFVPKIKQLNKTELVKIIKIVDGRLAEIINIVRELTSEMSLKEQCDMLIMCFGRFDHKLNEVLEPLENQRALTEKGDQE